MVEAESQIHIPIPNPLFFILPSTIPFLIHFPVFFCNVSFLQICTLQRLVLDNCEIEEVPPEQYVKVRTNPFKLVNLGMKWEKKKHGIS